MTPEQQARRLKRREKTQAWAARVAEANEMAKIEGRLLSDDKPTAHQRMRLAAWKAQGQSQRERFDFQASRYFRASRVLPSLRHYQQTQMGELRLTQSSAPDIVSDGIGWDFSATNNVWSKP